MTVTSPLVSDRSRSNFALFCNPESRRAEGFSIALGRLLRERPQLIPWQLLLERDAWENLIHDSPKFLRLESPGRNWKVEQQLLMRGATVADEESDRNWRKMTVEQIARLSMDPGRVLPMRQWFLGWRSVLQSLSAWASQKGWSSQWICPPEDVIRMFDKLACQRHLEDVGIVVPPSLGVPKNFDELWETMRKAGRRRVFLKPCHGSSASGVVALESTPTQIQAFSTLQIFEAAGEFQLFNSRRIRTYRGATDVRRLVDIVCAERCLTQVWVPKAGISGRSFDLRVVVIAGRARHVMVRLGRGPMTNSQLLGGKGDEQTLRLRMGDEAWSRMLALCEETMTKCFPQSLYSGLDVLIEPNFKTARVLEVNAFGDLLPRTLHDGRDTYTWEIEEAIRRRRRINREDEPESVPASHHQTQRP